MSNISGSSRRSSLLSWVEAGSKRIITFTLSSPGFARRIIATGTDIRAVIPHVDDINQVNTALPVNLYNTLESFKFQ
ncbi:hypothetical protein [Atlantibacter hermannii]|uniref:hypothetical protein n=1 Tax=Atlantibacter hermannii TaxID=565 RepID=UPI00332FDC10